MGSSNWVHLEVEEVINETEKAFLVLTTDQEELWIPFSQMNKSHFETGSLVKVGDNNITISITEWWANKQGIG